MMRTARIPNCRALVGAVLPMPMTKMMVRVRRTPMVVRKESGNGREGRVGRENGSRLRMGRGR